MPFITYLSGLLTAQMLSDDHLISGVEIHCEEKGRCPSTCHLCRRPGKEQLSPTPVLLEINRVVPLYALIQDNDTREVSELAMDQLHHYDPAIFTCQARLPQALRKCWVSQSGAVFSCTGLVGNASEWCQWWSWQVLLPTTYSPRRPVSPCLWDGEGNAVSSQGHGRSCLQQTLACRMRPAEGS